MMSDRKGDIVPEWVLGVWLKTFVGQSRVDLGTLPSEHGMRRALYLSRQHSCSLG